MAVKMDKFLLQYFMQMHFNEMPPEKFDTFVKYIKNGDDFPDGSDMKLWKRELVHQDASGKWIVNAIPDAQSPAPARPHIPNPNPWEMDDEEWAIRDRVILKGMIPDHVQALLINAASEKRYKKYPLT